MSCFTKGPNAKFALNECVFSSFYLRWERARNASFCVTDESFAEMLLDLLLFLPVPRSKGVDGDKEKHGNEGLDGARNEECGDEPKLIPVDCVMKTEKAESATVIAEKVARKSLSNNTKDIQTSARAPAVQNITESGINGLTDNQIDSNVCSDPSVDNGDISNNETKEAACIDDKILEINSKCKDEDNASNVDEVSKVDVEVKDNMSHRSDPGKVLVRKKRGRPRKGGDRILMIDSKCKHEENASDVEDVSKVDVEKKDNKGCDPWEVPVRNKGGRPRKKEQKRGRPRKYFSKEDAEAAKKEHVRRQQEKDNLKQVRC